jgi:hypothetical protein
MLMHILRESKVTYKEKGGELEDKGKYYISFALGHFVYKVS